MSTFNVGRLFAIWCALLLSLPMGVLWLRPDIHEGHRLAAASKVCILLAFTSSAGLVLALAVARRWASRLAQFNQFLEAFPARESELAIKGPPEIEALARSMSGMAERVRSIVE